MTDAQKKSGKVTSKGRHTTVAPRSPSSKKASKPTGSGPKSSTAGPDRMGKSQAMRAPAIIEQDRPTDQDTLLLGRTIKRVGSTSQPSSMSRAIEAAIKRATPVVDEILPRNALDIVQSLGLSNTGYDPAFVEEIIKAAEAAQNNPQLQEARRAFAALERDFNNEELRVARAKLNTLLNDPHLQAARANLDNMLHDPNLQAARAELDNLLHNPNLQSPAKIPAITSLQGPAKQHLPASISSVEEVGQRVREARQAMGMTQQQFADLAGVGRRFLIELEHGKPSLEIGKVLTVCKAAGIKIGFIE